MRGSRSLYQSVPHSPPEGFLEEEEDGETQQVVYAAPADLSRNSMLVKSVDLYDFALEVNVEDAQTLEQVKERVREQGRLWWSMEASKGVGWYLQPEISSLVPNATSSAPNVNHSKLLVTGVSITTVANTLLLKKLIRKGIPPPLRSKVWLAVSGAAKKRSMVPDSYFADLCLAGHGLTSAAIKQIDHVRALILRLIVALICFKQAQ